VSISAGVHDSDTNSRGATGVDGEAGQHKRSRSNLRSSTKAEGADAIESAKEQTREENTNEAFPLKADSVGDKLRNEGALVPVETLADSPQSTMHVESSVVVAPEQKPSPKQVRAHLVRAFTRRC
jgi:hypothetical protein